VSLRTRLLLAAALILGVVSLGAAVLRQTQQSFLTDAVDDQLRAARPLVRFPPPDRDGPVDSPTPSDTPSDEPISSLFIGYINDGEVVTVLQGQLLDDTPALDMDAAWLERVVDDGPFTTDGQNGSTRFRVAVVRSDTFDTTSVIALPLDEVDAAVNRLTWALTAGIAAIAGVLALAAWWIQRLGLRPVARLTAAADAVTRGARGHRVTGADPRTEAGRLANAFNVMLDQRDATEAHLRQFVADASHELRTPLTSIRGYLDLYRDGGFRGDGELDDVVRRMSQEANRMNDLVEDLLLLAKLDQRRPLRRERVDLGPLLRDIATDAQALQPDRPVIVDVPEDQAIDTIGDALRLQQVLAALVANALEHTDTDVQLHLTAETTGDTTTLTVADAGPGLDANGAARVFDRFYRGDHSRARRTGGSGLGLAIAKSIVEAHHGTIALDTAPGQGCRFTITLPRLEAGSDADAEQRADSGDPRA
jgi:two-component system OmpR family sensor kinase